VNHLNEKYRVGISPNQTLMTVGGRMALYLAFTTLPKGSKVGIISPDWSAYRDLCRYLGLQAIFFETTLEENWQISTEEIANSDCNALVLNNPSNPTGKILGTRTVEDLVKISVEKGITIISDEVYSDYILDPHSQFKSILQSDWSCKYIFTTSLSKSYSMTGYRAAYIVADPKTISALEKTCSLILTSPPEFVQHSLIAALQCQDYVANNLEVIRKRKLVAVDALRKYLGAEVYPPDGALYVFPRLGKNFDSEKFASKLLEEKFVSVTPGTSFGSRYIDHIRMTLLQGEERLVEGIERMAACYSAT
jgi:aspartate aminotransferase